jgi:hypothetical protein
MASPEKMVSSSKKRPSISKTPRPSTPKINEDGMLLRRMFDSSLKSKDKFDVGNGMGDVVGRKGATFLGDYIFAGIGEVVGGVEFYKTAQRFVVANGAKYNCPRSMLLLNNPQARDVPVARIKEFIENSSMALRRYSPNNFMCGDFSSRLHNKAEDSGIRCGFVLCEYLDGDHHAFNIFCGLDGRENPVPVFADMTFKSKMFLTEAMFKKHYAHEILRLFILV